MRLLDTSEAAVMLHSSRTYIKDLVSRGVLTNYSGRPNRIKVSVADIERGILAGSIKPRPKYGPRLDNLT